MPLQTWLAFCITEAVLCLTPGPAVLFVVSAAMSRGGWNGLAASLGILAGNAFYFLVSATGIAAVILASSQLFTAVKWCGAAYLLWMGSRLLLSRAAAPMASAPQPIRRSPLGGFIVQAANPKALVFFIALLPQFIDSQAPVPAQILILGASSILIEFVVLSAYAAIAVRTRELAGRRWSRALERAGGGFLVAAGARLAWLRTN